MTILYIKEILSIRFGEMHKVLGAKVVEVSHLNKNANHRECWIRDLDGYVLVLASAYGNI